MTDEGGRAGTDLQKRHPAGLSTSFQPGLGVSLFSPTAKSYVPAPTLPEDPSQSLPWTSTLSGPRGFEAGREAVQRRMASAPLRYRIAKKSPFGPALRCLFTTLLHPNALALAHFFALVHIYHLVQRRRRLPKLPPRPGRRR